MHEYQYIINLLNPPQSPFTKGEATLSTCTGSLVVYKTCTVGVPLARLKSHVLEKKQAQPIKQGANYKFKAAL